jgi:hypothetical protein
MATTCGKAARRKYGTKAAAKRARKHAPKDFGTPESEKTEYRAMKQRKRNKV